MKKALKPAAKAAHDRAWDCSVKDGDSNRFEVHLPKGKKILNHGHTGIDLEDGRSFDLWTSLYKIKGDTAIWSITILGVSKNESAQVTTPANPNNKPNQES